MADAPTKVCPDCAEDVREAARVCRFCGYRFEPPVVLGEAAPVVSAPEAAIDVPEAAKSARARWWDYALLSGVGQLALVFAASYWSNTVGEHPLSFLLDALLVTALATWIGRRRYRGFLMWWRRAIPILWVLGLVSRAGQTSEAASSLAATLTLFG